MQTFRTVTMLICCDFFHHNGNLILENTLEKSFEFQNDLLKNYFQIKLFYTCHCWESQHLNHNHSDRQHFIHRWMLEKFTYLRFSHCSDYGITQRTAKCIYLLGGVIELIWEQWNCPVRECWSLSGSARRSERKWRVRKKKGLNAVSSLIYCSFSPPLPLSPNLLLLFRSSFQHFKRKHAAKMICFFCTEH